MLWYSAVIGTIGALTGGFAFGWRIHEWKRGRETRVRVLIKRVALQLPGEILLTTAINESEHPVRILSAGVELKIAATPEASPRLSVPPPPGA